MLPAFFGLLKFTQWGGMYTDSWCHIRVYSGSPFTGAKVEEQYVIASTIGPPIVYGPPVHNHLTCLMWARTVQCGKVTPQGWTIKWASPQFKGQRYYDPKNACDIPLSPVLDWFRLAS